MSKTTKYSAAPQRDSFEESAYTQAPPAYNDQPSASNDQDALLGGPRGEDDAVPDDFKVCDGLVPTDMVVGCADSVAVWRIRGGGDT